jgi:ABC-type polysaccharide/polyol phosphate transport system ATPase subunit
MSLGIEVKDASLTFSIYRNRSPKLKEALVSNNRIEQSLNNVLKVSALGHINLSIKAGERVGIIGFNGAGKSTLLRLILGIYPPDSGHITVHGSIAPMLDLTGHFDFESTGRDNIYLHGAYLGYPPSEMKAIEEDIVVFAEIGDFVDIPVKYYSSGMVGRLAFAIATMLHADILLLDEVFAVGDGYYNRKAADRMLRLIDKSQILVMASHSVKNLREVCNRIVWLHEGGIVGDGNVEDMLEAYKDFIDSKSNTGLVTTGA